MVWLDNTCYPPLFLHRRFYLFSDPGFKHSAVYYQVITQESGAESGGLINGSGIRISRSGLWEATAFCYYDAEGRVHSSFGVEQEDSLVLHGTQEFSYKMQIAQSSAFTSFFEYVQNIRAS